MGKTRRRKASAHATCVLAPNEYKVTGTIFMRHVRGGVRFRGEIAGLDDGEHGIHIHQYGDLTEGCKSACAHFNPRKANHGSRTSKVRHLGDLGNITSEKGLSKFDLFGKDVSLRLADKHNIAGRMIVVHADRDDLGQGGDAESLVTGNAGKRLACGVIGLASKCSSKRITRKREIK